MDRYYLIFLILISVTANAEDGVTTAIKDSITDIKATVVEINESYKQCEALYDEIRSSECANSIFGIFGRMHLKLGVSFTERQLKFQNASSEDDVFILSSGSKPRPIYSISVNDSYFTESNWGYGFGFDYFDDYAFEQVIQRGSSNKASFDLGSYSSMSVVSVSPSVFYSWGRGDSTPNRYFKVGLGLNLMYSAVRGTAYETELNTVANAGCYSAASDLLSGASLGVSGLIDQCDLQHFRESSYGTGTKLFLAGEWNKWESELAISLYNHRGNGEYRFVTQQVLLGFSRKFAF
jgi:hypothetical protein